MMRGRKGLTVVELVVTLLIVSAMAAMMFYVYRTILTTWSKESTALVAGMRVNHSIEQVSRELRGAQAVQSTAGRHEFQVTTNGSTYYIYYLYNPNDTYGPPPSFNQTTYELKRTRLTGGFDSNFNYGDGVVLVGNVLPPPTSTLSQNGNRFTIDLQVDTEASPIHSRMEIRPRNL